MLFDVLFCFLHHRVQHDVRIADNLSKSLEVMKVVTCFVYDEFLTFCYWEVTMSDIWSILNCSRILKRGYLFMVMLTTVRSIVSCARSLVTNCIS